MSKTVKIDIPATNEVLTIPAAELAPGMVEVDMDGVGRVWISAADVKLKGNYKQPPFNVDIHPLLQHLKTALDEVYPKSLAEWEAIFRKDSNPGQEMSHWLFARNGQFSSSKATTIRGENSRSTSGSAY